MKISLPVARACTIAPLLSLQDTADNQVNVSFVFKAPSIMISMFLVDMRDTLGVIHEKHALKLVSPAGNGWENHTYAFDVPLDDQGQKLLRGPSRFTPNILATLMAG